MMLSYLGCDSDRYLLFLAYCIFAVFRRGLPTLIVCLAGAVETGRSSEEEKSRRRLPKANMMIISSWLSPSRLKTTSKDVSDILTPLLFSDVADLVFPLLEAYSAFSARSLIAKTQSANSDPVSPLASARLCVFACVIYFRFGIKSELPIESSCIAK
jgi:hypothetical protein